MIIFRIFSVSAAGRTLLHLAAEIGDAASCALLHRRGAKINAEDLHGASPLHLAAATGNGANVEYLLKSGASSAKRKKDGSTPTHEAAQAGHRHVLGSCFDCYMFVLTGAEKSSVFFLANKFY